MRRIRISTALLAVPLLYVSAVAAPSEKPELATAPAPVKDALLVGEHEKAVTLLDELLTSRKESADYWLLLKGTALSLAGKPAEAVSAFERLEKEHPESLWIHKARYRRAEAHRRLRQFEEAERIYEAETRRLMDPERKGALAGIYIRFADELSTPPDVQSPDAPKPDYERAYVLYQKVLDLGTARELREHALFRMGHCKQQVSNWDQARKDYNTYLEEFDPSRHADRKEPPAPGARVFEARHNLAECLLQKGQREPARREWEDLAAALAEAIAGEGVWGKVGVNATDESRTRLSEQRGRALFAISRTYRIGNVDETLFAITALRKFLEQYPGQEAAPGAAFSIGESYMKIGRDEEALQALDAYVAGKGYEVRGEKAREEAARLEMRAQYLKGTILLRQEKFGDAIGVWKQYTAKYPTGSDWANAQQGIIQAEYQVGVTHRREKRFQEAREAWTGFLERHPLDGRARQILLDLGELYVEEAAELEKTRGDKAPRQELERLNRAAIAQWRRLVTKYPGTQEASRGQFRIGELHETRLKELEKAIEAYGALDWGSFASRAKARLEQMTGKELTILTERSARTDEPLRVKLQLRNLEKVAVSLYKLDLEAYFRKHQGIGQVENLDLDLISPDNTFEVDVEGYAKYKPIEQHVELPVQGPGAFAVAVTADKLRATTLVLSSDVDIIVKSSRRELLVFAENMLRRAPAPGVTVLVTVPRPGPQGKRITLVEGKTDKDGIYRYKPSSGGSRDDLLPEDMISVFAIRDGHCASNALNLGGLGLSSGLEPRGYIVTDRPAYRRGQEVHIRAILREVDERGAYTFEEGRKYRLEIADSQGRVFEREELGLGPFGTLHHSLTLDRFAPVGNYTIRCQAAEGATFSGSFQVQEYKLEKIALNFDLPRSVYFRGEKVEGTVQAAYHYGEPVAGAALRYVLPDGRTVTTRTDEDGEATFEFTTESFPREGPLTIRADLTEERVSGTHAVFLAIRGYAASVSTLRTVFLEGEKFDATVSTTAATGDPTGRELKLRILRRESEKTPRRGRTFTEVLIEELDVKTDEKTGKARQSITISKGGQYVIRAEGADRFGNPITGETQVYISGQEDKTRLRLLTDTQHVKVGEKLTVNLHNRTGPGLALLTFEGEEIIEYRLVNLREGANRIEIEVGHDLFPNFALAAALMQADKFYQTSTDFEVTRKLNVIIQPEKETYAPGEKATVKLKVTDQLGRPVKAELSLAVVDESLLAVYPELVGEITGFFQEGARRVAALRTTTSCTFSYRGATSTVAPAVLEELARRQTSLGDVRAARQWAGQQVLLEGFVHPAGQGGAQEDMPGIVLDLQMEQAGANIVQGMPVPGAHGGLARAPEPRRRYAWFSIGGDFGGGGAGAPVREAFLETAFWTPSVVTDGEGEASVDFEVPSQATKWRLVSRGVTSETIVGQNTATMTARKDFFVELKAPASLMEGDRPRFTVRVHNLTGKGGTADLKLRLRSGDSTETFPARVELPEEGVAEHVYPLAPPIPLCEEVVIEAEAVIVAGDREVRDALRRTVPVTPWGLEYADSASGVLTQDASFSLELPDGRQYRDRRLLIAVDPGLEQMLIDEALRRTPFPYAAKQLASTVTQAGAASELLGTCAVMEYLSALGRREAPEYRLLVERAGALLSRLVAAQHQDGGWAWAGQRAKGEPRTSAMALWALGRARKLGLTVPSQTVEKGIAYLQKAFTGAAQQANELKAMLLHGLTVHGKGDFGFANRLYRLRQSLSPAALAYTSLTLSEMDKGTMAAEVAAGLEKYAETLSAEGASPVQCRWQSKDNTAWNRASLEMAGLAILALERALPRSELVVRGATYLEGRRPWYPAKARGVVLAALAYYYRENRPEAADATVAVRVNGQDIRKIEFGGRAEGAVLSIPPELLGNGAVRVEMTLSGRGRPGYVATLRGFSPDVKAKAERRFQVSSHVYHAAPPVHRGREVATGFRILQGIYNRWDNTVSRLPLGHMTRVRLDVDRSYDSRRSEDDDDYLVIDVSIPAGTSVLQGSVIGSFDYYQAGDGMLTFFVGSRRQVGDIYYTLLGYLPGEYRVLPVVVRSTYDPSLLAIGGASEFSVLGRGEESPDKYRPTPDELYHLGTAYFNEGLYEKAGPVLEALFQGWQRNLRDEPYRETARMLLFVNIEKRDAPAIVRYFEVIKEKYPELTIPFEKVLAVGDAYRAIEEYERALLVFRATIDETFGKDLKVAGTLEEQGEFLGSADTLERLWLEAPDLPSVVSAYLTLSDQLYTKTPSAGDDPKLKEAGVDREALMQRTIAILSRFLTLYPEDPLADDAGLSLVSAHMALEDHENAADLAARLADRFREPEFRDSFVYSRAVASWYLNRYGEAIRLASEVAEARYTDAGGRVQVSENRNLALYIIGQIHHARREVARAIEFYERVQNEFPDAREAIEHFRLKRLAVPEVTTFRPGQKANLELDYRNVKEAEVLVYGVDLMTLYLREKNLSNVTKVNLAGITPAFRQRVTLGEGTDYTDKKRDISLKVEKPGAYLVICRGDELHASGLLLITPLELDVSEDAMSGRVRVNVMRRADKEYVSGVEVKVIGSANDEFMGGKTDPRGVFLADNIRGTAAVIARQEKDHFAFYRGKTPLGPPEIQQQETQQAAEPAAEQQLDYLDNVNRRNTMMQQKRFEVYKGELKKARKGVQVQDAY